MDRRSLDYLRLFATSALAISAMFTSACGGKSSLAPSDDSSTTDAGNASSAEGGTADSNAPEPACQSLGAPANVTADDLYGYPPYAAYGCSLVYVQAETSALVLRDLTAGTEQVIAPASEHPRRPTIAKDVIAWESRPDGSAASQIRVFYNGSTTTLAGAFDHAGEPRAADGVIAFTAWIGAADGSDTDVLLYRASDAHTDVVAGGRGQQRFSDVSRTHVAVTDFSEDPDGTFNQDGNDLADIGFFDRANATYALRASPGKQAFPVIVSDDAFAYLQWGLHRPEPKFQAFTVAGGVIAASASGDASLQDVVTQTFVQPSGRYGEVFWVAQSMTDGTFALSHADVTGATPASAVAGLAGTIGAPASSKGLTLVALGSGAGPATLRAVPR